MPAVAVRLFENRPLLDLVSHARRGPSARDRLTPGELQQISRTVRRAPEVMVKVLTRGADDPGAVRRHLAYLGRCGEVPLEDDQGDLLEGKDAPKRLVEGWDLDLEQVRAGEWSVTGGRRAGRLVHKIILSMPPGTPPKKVLAAARDFAREEFALTHRYALALHVDEPHPHVHLVVKAMSEQGVRLNIRKATLRHWRSEFARRLRDHGVEANATERAVRGETRAPQSDGLYRAEQRGVSTRAAERLARMADELLEGFTAFDPDKSRLLRTRRDVERGWLAVADRLDRGMERVLAARTREFVRELPAVLTDRERTRRRLLERTGPTRLCSR